jgi:carbon starvation protein CstA
MAALSLLIVTIWLVSAGRNPAYAGIPMVFMYVTTMAATIVTAYNLYATIILKPRMAAISVAGAWVMIGVAILLLIAAVVIAIDGWQAWMRYTTRPRPAPATPAAARGD